MNRIQIVDKKNCCGCGACEAACPKKAIKLKEDECGFLYPVVDETACVDCGLCKKVCMYEEAVPLKEPLHVYAAASRSDAVLKESASGGIFFEAAKAILQQGGVVYGCAYEGQQALDTVSHIRVEELNQLKRLQGSKYVQSSIRDCFVQVKQDLKAGRKVLFSGTPCQVGALYKYLGGQSYENLYTIDIICHGVPNMTFFHDYIRKMEKCLRGKIINIRFRDKTEGWGYKGTILYRDRQGSFRKKKMPLQGFPYYKMFLDSDTCRESCYHCLYAKGVRASDMTIGDYWEIEKLHPEFDASIEKGISCIIVNTPNGEQLLDRAASNLSLLESNIELASRYNNQLKTPTRPAGFKDQILKAYREGGYERVEKEYYKRFGIKSFLYKMWNYLPGSKIDEENTVVRKNEKCN